MKRSIILLYFFHLFSSNILAAFPAKCISGALWVDLTGTSGYNMYVCNPDDTWTLYNGQGGGGSIPAGSILLVNIGTCPTGFSEVAGLVGKTLFGTNAANADVGTTGGADNITPTTASTNLTAAAQTFTGASATSSAVSAGTPAGTNGTSTVTPLGSNSTSTVTPLGTNGTSTAAAQTFTGASSTVIVNHVHVQNMNTAITGATGAGFPAVADPSTSGGPGALWVSTANPTGGSANYTPAGTNGTSAVNAQTFTGALSTVGAQTFTGAASTVGAQIFTGGALGTHDHIVTANGSNGSSAVSGTITNNSFDNRSAFMKVIFCSKN